jgi:hypothetical protein
VRTMRARFGAANSVTPPTARMASSTLRPSRYARLCGARACPMTSPGGT